MSPVPRGTKESPCLKGGGMHNCEPGGKGRSVHGFVPIGTASKGKGMCPWPTIPKWKATSTLFPIKRKKSSSLPQVPHEKRKENIYNKRGMDITKRGKRCWKLIKFGEFVFFSLWSETLGKPIPGSLNLEAPPLGEGGAPQEKGM